MKDAPTARPARLVPIAAALTMPTVAWRWLAGFALVAAAAVLAILLALLTPLLPHVLPGYPGWLAGAYSRAGSFLRWCVGDTTEAEFFKSAIGGLGMLAGGWAAHAAYRRGSRWAGFPISYGTGLWPWLLASAALGLLLSDVAWGWTLSATATWQPTFVPFVSVPPAVVLVYGAGWRVAGTGAVLGAVLTTPISLAVVNFFCYPLGLPAVIGNVTGMWAGALIAFFICRHLPWMPSPLAGSVGDAGQEDVTAADEQASAPLRQGPAWVVRRVLADFTEAQFYGNEVAAVGLIGGTVLTYLLNPAAPVYGSKLLPAMLAAQVLTATIGVLVYRRQWASAGWYPTFVPVVSVAPAVVLTFGATVQAVAVGAVLGALAGPPLAAWVAKRLPADFHPFIGNVVSMTVCTLIIVPLLGALPGFTAVS